MTALHQEFPARRHSTASRGNKLRMFTKEWHCPKSGRNSATIFNFNGMKKIHLLFGLVTAATVAFLSFFPELGNSPRSSDQIIISPAYQWNQVAPPGSGTHQHEWKPGTYASAVVPLVAFEGNLWMVGQKRVWTSTDGVHWNTFEKHDWGERISTVSTYFRDKLFISGGMDYNTNTFLNEIWTSSDAKTWTKAVPHAEWSPRKNHELIEFKGGLWLFGGETSVDNDKAPDEFVNDAWFSADGIRWTRVMEQAPWPVRANPQMLVFKEKLWLVGGQGHSDIWNTTDGKTWTKIAEESPWKDRYDYGVALFDGLMWVYGGRESNPRNAYNDVWFSPDGVNWVRQTADAPWSRRSGGFSVAFKDKLFLYGGKHTGHPDGFSGDIWTMERLKN